MKEQRVYLATFFSVVGRNPATGEVDPGFSELDVAAGPGAEEAKSFAFLSCPSHPACVLQTLVLEVKPGAARGPGSFFGGWSVEKAELCYPGRTVPLRDKFRWPLWDLLRPTR